MLLHVLIGLLQVWLSLVLLWCCVFGWVTLYFDFTLLLVWVCLWVYLWVCLFASIGFAVACFYFDLLWLLLFCLDDCSCFGTLLLRFVLGVYCL